MCTDTWVGSESHTPSWWFESLTWGVSCFLLPGKSHGWKSLEGCSPWGCKESHMTERLNTQHTILNRLGVESRISVPVPPLPLTGSLTPGFPPGQ